MRWMTFKVNGGAERFGYVRSGVAGDDVIDVTGQPHATLKDAIAADALATLAAVDGQGYPLTDIEYCPVITQPNKILCAGLNYHAHRLETGRGEGDAKPTIFTRFAAAQMGHQQPMVRPLESESLDFEGEIAIIIGKPGRRISQQDALSHVAGYSIYNDGSVRDWQRFTSQFTPGKNFASTGGFGPWLMTPDEVGDPYAMQLTTRLNGEVMQDASSSLLIFNFQELIEFCSTWIELEAGDVLVTGTPGGVGAARKPPVFMDKGDQIEVEVQPIGKLVNQVIVG